LLIFVIPVALYSYSGQIITNESTFGFKLAYILTTTSIWVLPLLYAWCTLICIVSRLSFLIYVRCGDQAGKSFAACLVWILLGDVKAKVAARVNYCKHFAW